MKWSATLHILTVIVGIFGILALVGSWIATFSGSFLGFTEAHLFNNTISLMLIAVWLSFGTIIHKWQEAKKEKGW